MIENKERLITFLAVALRNFVVMHLAIKRFERNPSLPQTVTFGIKEKRQEITINLKDLCANMETGETINTDEVFVNCKRSLSRAISAETFELIKLYSQRTSQSDRFKNWRYYNFARILRNCTSHGTGGRLNKWPPELKKQGITKVSWRGKSIDESMVGQRISMTDPEIVQLLLDEVNYVKRNLT